MRGSFFKPEFAGCGDKTNRDSPAFIAKRPDRFEYLLLTRPCLGKYDPQRALMRVNFERVIACAFARVPITI